MIGEYKLFSPSPFKHVQSITVFGVITCLKPSEFCKSLGIKILKNLPILGLYLNIAIPPFNVSLNVLNFNLKVVYLIIENNFSK